MRYNNSMKNNFAKNLKQLMKEERLRQQQLAWKLHISQSIVSDWINEHKEPTLTNLIKLAELFNTTIDDLVDGTKY